MSTTENIRAAVLENTAQIPMKVDVKIGSIRPEGSIRLSRPLI